MIGQLALADDPDYDAEHIAGATGPSFPIIITPTTHGASIQAPPDVEWATAVQPDGSVVVALRFTRE